MKRWLAIIFVFSLFLTACNNASTSTPKNGEEEQDITINTSTHEHDGLLEPAEDEVCAFCNMKVYEKENNMGVFTSMAKDQNGKTLFFDDSGCLLNYERKTGEKVTEKMVRDYLTSDWVSVEEATVVKADIETPMNYGYAFFKEEKSAQEYITDHPKQNATISSLIELDEVANKKFKMKMQKMKNEQSPMEHNQNNDEGETHN